jgi:hypothetical protein
MSDHSEDGSGAPAKSASPKTYVVWTEAAECALLDKIIVDGVHLASNNVRAAKWEGIKHDLMNTCPDMRKYRGAEVADRLLPDKFAKLKKEAKAFMETGNKSGHSGDLSKKMKLIKQCIDEEEEQRETRGKDKAISDADKILIDTTGDKLMTKRSTPSVASRDSGKRVKHADGTITDHRKTTPSRSFDDRLLDMLSGNGGNACEAEVEVVMNTYIAELGLEVNDLVDVYSFPNAVMVKWKDDIDLSVAMLEGLTMKSIVNMYCQTGAAFNATIFHKATEKMCILMLVSVKAFTTLETWRKRATAYVAVEVNKDFEKPAAFDDDERDIE